MNAMNRPCWLTCQNPALVCQRGARIIALATYCLEPVVLLFGFGEQFRFCGLASFSQAAMLAYLQFNAPLADVLIQNGEVPIV